MATRILIINHGGLIVYEFINVLLQIGVTNIELKCKKTICSAWFEAVLLNVSYFYLNCDK